MKQLENLTRRNFEKLEKVLNEKEKDLFKKYTDCINEYMLVVGEQAFCDGFCLGTRIAAEAFFGAEQMMWEP